MTHNNAPAARRKPWTKPELIDLDYDTQDVELGANPMSEVGGESADS
ncbi:MAG: hypothetical protein AAGK02_16010 [Pseudomonadota bacterium]